MRTRVGGKPELRREENENPADSVNKKIEKL